MPTAALLDVGVLSHPGIIRPDNQDTWGFAPNDIRHIKPATGSLALVADGVGGGARGEEASRLAKDTFIKTYFGDAAGTVPERLQAAAAAANSAVYERAQALGGETMATTLVAAAILPNGQTHIVNVGDSRAYLYRQGQVKQLTRDHNLAALAPTDPDGVLNPHAQNMLTRCIGAQPSTIADPFQIMLARGDNLLLCTDGLTKHLNGDDELEQHLRRLQKADAAAAALVNLANARGGTDNITVMVIKFGAESERYPAAAGNGTKTIVPPRPGKRPHWFTHNPTPWIITAILASLLLAFIGLYALDIVKFINPFATATPAAVATVQPKIRPTKTATAIVSEPTQPAPSTAQPTLTAGAPTSIGPEPTVAPSETMVPNPTPRATTAGNPTPAVTCQWKIIAGDTVDTIAIALLGIEGSPTPTSLDIKTRREKIVKSNNLQNNGDDLAIGDELVIEGPFVTQPNSDGTCPRK